MKAEGVGECDMLELLSGTGLLCNLQLWQLRILLLLRIATSNIMQAQNIRLYYTATHACWVLAC